MTKTLLEKMFCKPEYAVAITHCPKDLALELNSGIKADDALIEKYNFILAFYTQLQELENEVEKFKESLQENGLLWIAYPKAKALQTDLNRDIIRNAMEPHQLTTVSIVSLNETWSALRFKKT